ncbi:Ribonuclease H1 [Colletotrichum siamense]|nr:Ribonuclease H1 [Colletotrichum siamense]
MYHPYKRPQASDSRRKKPSRGVTAAPKHGNQPQSDQRDKASGPILSRSSGSLRGAFFQNNDGKIELFDGQTGFTHMCSPSSQHSGHEDPLVIAIDGACPGNGTVRATKSGYGVFFAPGNPNNTAARIPNHLLEGAKHTNNIAEIMSAISALHGATIVARGGIQRYTDAVKHGDYVDKLREMGVTVQFWHVRRELNKDADRLANEGLVLGASAVSSTVEEEIKRVWKAQGVSRKGRSHSDENEVIVLDDD